MKHHIYLKIQSAIRSIAESGFKTASWKGITVRLENQQHPLVSRRGISFEFNAQATNAVVLSNSRHTLVVWQRQLPDATLEHHDGTSAAEHESNRLWRFLQDTLNPGNNRDVHNVAIPWGHLWGIPAELFPWHGMADTDLITVSIGLQRVARWERDHEGTMRPVFEEPHEVGPEPADELAGMVCLGKQMLEEAIAPIS